MMNNSNEMALLAAALIAGTGIGAIFFGGLWWTIRKGVTARRPWLWFTVSLLLRLSIVIGGFYFISGGAWKPLLACLLGFLIARQMMIRLTRPAAGLPKKKEANYENQPG